jgi:hypothetical protein
MNRSIKIRIWNKNKNYFDFFDLYKDNLSVENYIDPTIQVYTGLSDHDGKDIYEGDLIKYTESDILYEVVYVFDKYLARQINQKDSFVFLNNIPLANFLKIECETKIIVFGNIFQNEIKNNE